MVPNAQHSEFPSLEERIRRARAERSIAAGAMIGDALNALWAVLSSFPFSPSASSRRKRADRARHVRA
jgi:hypothetical protein